MRSEAQRGQCTPLGQRRAARYALQASSVGKRRSHSLTVICLVNCGLPMWHFPLAMEKFMPHPNSSVNSQIVAFAIYQLGFVLRGGLTPTWQRPCRPSPENKPINGFQGPLPLAEVPGGRASWSGFGAEAPRPARPTRSNVIANALTGRTTRRIGDLLRRLTADAEHRQPAPHLSVRQQSEPAIHAGKSLRLHQARYAHPSLRR